jgi:hypothetical protein
MDWADCMREEEDHSMKWDERKQVQNGDQGSGNCVRREGDQQQRYYLEDVG